jgi:chromosome segregation ATPase
MMNTTEQFTAWRAEIEAELTEARAEVAQAEADLAHARAARGDVAAKGEAIREALAPLRDSTASALRGRLSSFDQGLRQADGAITRATAVLQNAQNKVGDLETGLAQITGLMTPPEPAEESAEVTL